MNRVMRAEYLASTLARFLASTEVAFSIKTIFAIATAKRIFALFVALLLSAVLIAEPIPNVEYYLPCIALVPHSVYAFLI